MTSATVLLQRAGNPYTQTKEALSDGVPLHRLTLALAAVARIALARVEELGILEDDRPNAGLDMAEQWAHGQLDDHAYIEEAAKAASCAASDAWYVANDAKLRSQDAAAKRKTKAILEAFEAASAVASLAHWVGNPYPLRTVPRTCQHGVESAGQALHYLGEDAFAAQVRVRGTFSEELRRLRHENKAI